jgi:hypothetical protein
MNFYQSPEDFLRTAKRQRSIASEIADKLMSGAPLDESARGFAAAILREWAARPVKRDKRKDAAKFCHATAAKMFALKRADGLHETLAADHVAESLGVSRTALLKAIKPHVEKINAMRNTYLKK